MDSLRSLASPTATVTRAGETKQIPALHVVPGDIVHVKMGDVVPADLRLYQCVCERYSRSQHAYCNDQYLQSRG